MPTLRKLLASAFGTVALIAAFVSLGIGLPVLLHPHRIHFAPLHQVATPWIKLGNILLGGLALLLLVMPAVLAVLYGIAWWTLKRTKSSARQWAIAASAAMVVQVLPLVVVIGYMVRDYPFLHSSRSLGAGQRTCRATSRRRRLRLRPRLLRSARAGSV